MRFTVDKLRTFAQRVVEERRRDLNLLAAYLIGSLVDGDPFLGGAADADVVLVYNGPPPQEQERLTLHDAIFVDLHLHDRAAYEPPRPLRTDPLWGTALFYARALYDPQHFLDFVQSAVRSRFKQPEIAYQRAQTALERARGAWAALHEPLTPEGFQRYLEAVSCGANALAALANRWLPPRRLAPRFAQVAQRLGRPDWVATLYRLLGAPNLPPEEELDALLARAHKAAQGLAEEEAVEARYYLRAAEALAQGAVPNQALYPLLWWLTQQAAAHPEAAPALSETLSTLGLNAVETLRSLSDAWLDEVEEFLEAWGHAQGVV